MNSFTVYTKYKGVWLREKTFSFYTEALKYCYTELYRRKNVKISKIGVFTTKSLNEHNSWDAFGHIPMFVSNRKQIKKKLEQIKVDRRQKAAYNIRKKGKFSRMNGLEEKGINL